MDAKGVRETKYYDGSGKYLWADGFFSGRIWAVGGGLFTQGRHYEIEFYFHNTFLNLSNCVFCRLMPSIKSNGYRMDAHPSASIMFTCLIRYPHPFPLRLSQLRAPVLFLLFLVWLVQQCSLYACDAASCKCPPANQQHTRPHQSKEHCLGMSATDKSPTIGRRECIVLRSSLLNPPPHPLFKLFGGCLGFCSNCSMLFPILFVLLLPPIVEQP